MEWQDIETAPKDGRDILVWVNSPGSALVANWHEGFWYCLDLGFGVAVTHWMPLPNPPEANQ